MPSICSSGDNEGHKPDKKIKIFYAYRLTYTPTSGEAKKQYYMGYRGCTTRPEDDYYFSSSESVKKLVSQEGVKAFKKKILGVYSTQEEALTCEINYHKKLKVDTNAAFLNKARQTSTKFSFDNTGRVNTPESNQLRSDALRGRSRLTPEGKARISQYQTTGRVRTPKELEALKEGAIQRNKEVVTCPYCQKKGQKTAMLRWHFENCTQAPNPSPEILNQRKLLREKMQNINKQNLNQNDT